MISEKEVVVSVRTWVNGLDHLGVHLQCGCT